MELLLLPKHQKRTKRFLQISRSCPSFILCLSIVVAQLLPFITDSHNKCFFIIPIVSGNPTQVALPPKIQSLHPEPNIIRKKGSDVPITSFPSPMFVFHRKRHNKLQVLSNPQDESLKVNMKNVKQDFIHRCKIASYFALWYALNVIFNSTLHHIISFCTIYNTFFMT